MKKLNALAAFAGSAWLCLCAALLGFLSFWGVVFILVTGIVVSCRIREPEEDEHVRGLYLLPCICCEHWWNSYSTLYS